MDARQLDPVTVRIASLRNCDSRRDAFVFFRDAVDLAIDRTLAHQALQLFVRTEAQHFFTPTGRVALPEVEQENVEQRLEFK